MQVNIASPNKIYIIIPIIIGAYMSGLVYLSEGSAIPLTIFQLALIAGFAVFVFYIFAVKNLEIQFYGLEKEYILFLSIIFFSLIYSPEREQGIFYVIRYMVLIGMTYLIYNCIETAKNLNAAIKVIIGAAFLLALGNIYQFYINPEVAAFNYVNQGARLIRSSGAEADPNILASNFFMPIMLVIVFIGRFKTKRAQLLLFSMVGVMIFSVLLTYSRSSWVALFVGVLLVSLIQRDGRFIILSTVIFLLLFLVSDSIRTIFFSILERLGDVFAGTSDDSSKFRIILFQTAILMWLDTYTFGIGYQGFSTVFKEYHPPQETAWIYEPHNEFYTVLAELGTIGFVVFVYLILKILKRGWNSVMLLKNSGKDYSIQLALFASFICYLVFFQFLGGMQLHSLYMINIGLLFASIKIAHIEEGQAATS
ncbi:MAG: hypothetical protein ED557_11620 [Balneola sp.]|nr:MAG: hypothetical protein ED557_11620 [Balneola sp.]